MLNLHSYMLDCHRCGHLFFLPEDGEAALERHGWRRHKEGGWNCPLCSELEGNMGHFSLDEIDRIRAAEAAEKLKNYQTEVRLAHRRIVLCLVGLSLIVGLFLYLLK